MFWIHAVTNWRNSTMLGCAVAILMASGAASASVESERKEILQMHDAALERLYRERKGSQNLVTNAPGYAVFKNANVNVIFASFGGGYGVVRNNQSGANTYMNMAEVGLGLGVGAKDYRLIMVFHDENTMKDFIQYGWDFGGQADATAKAGRDGAAASAEGKLQAVTIYMLTETGLSVQATLSGTKYWKDDKLN